MKRIRFKSGKYKGKYAIIKHDSPLGYIKIYKWNHYDQRDELWDVIRNDEIIVEDLDFLWHCCFDSKEEAQKQFELLHNWIFGIEYNVIMETN